jgi:micrococcal nuclease
MRNWLTPMVLCCAAAAAHADEFAAKVIVVLDGDTVMVMPNCDKEYPKTAGTTRSSPCGDHQPVKIRLAEIDAPEKAQPGGVESKQSLSGMVLKKHVIVNAQTVDKYGRLVAHLALNGKNVNEEQVRRGMAWEYSNHHSNKAYIGLQNEAKRARRGLWAEDRPVPPWEWRKLHEPDSAASTQPYAAITAGPAGTTFTCGGKRSCAQMRSCAEARFYLTQCGVQSLDGNGDGVPCETLCTDKKSP